MKHQIKLAIFDFINGIWSNIPLCCTWYFTKRVLFNGEHAIAYNVHMERTPHLPYGSYGIEYVQCDKCYRKNRIADINLKNGTILKGLLK